MSGRSHGCSLVLSRVKLSLINTPQCGPCSLRRPFQVKLPTVLGRLAIHRLFGSYLVDPASSHMLVSKIKPCMSKYKQLYGETANGSLNQL